MVLERSFIGVSFKCAFDSDIIGWLAAVLYFFQAGDGIRGRKTTDRRAEVRFPKHLTSLIIEGSESSVVVATKYKPSAGCHKRQCSSALLVLPCHVARIHRDRPHRADFVSRTWRKLLNHADAVDF